MANKVLSGIIGLCVADALGVPVEFQDRETLSKNPVVDMRGYGTYNQPPGTWSDDTSMTLCLIDSLATKLDFEDIMKKFLQWYENGDYTPHGDAFDVGIATSKALMKYKNGTNPLHCGGTSEYDNGNGSLMRILPLLFYIQSKYGNEFFEEEEPFEIIHQVSALTHAHKRSQMACGIYISIAAMVSGKMDLQIAVSQGVYQAMRYYRSNPSFTSELHHFKRLESNHFANLSSEEICSSGYVVDTLEAAIWCLLTTNSYKECVLKAINLGEDTDTVAAVAGGLAGLRYGYDRIPKEWLNKIVKRDDVENLCYKLNRSLIRTTSEKLFSFIPYFETATYESVCTWSNGENLGEKQFVMGYPQYSSEFSMFIKEVYNTNLLCSNYTYFTNDILEEKHSAIETADIDLLRAILTYYVKEERFSDGSWASAVEKKVFLRILVRLQELLGE